MPDFSDQLLKMVINADTSCLTIRQTAILSFVYECDFRYGVKELAENLNIVKPAITRAIDHLVRLGLVKRETNPADRRQICLLPTDKGSSLARYIFN